MKATFIRSRTILIGLLLSAVPGLAAEGDADSDGSSALQLEYAEVAKGMNPTELLVKTGAITAAAGFVAGTAPSVINTGNTTVNLAISGAILLADAGVVAYMSYRHVYTSGAIMARERSCPQLVESGDFESVLGVLFGGFDKEKLVGLAKALALPPATAGAQVATKAAARKAAAKALQQAVKQVALPYLGTRATGRLMQHATLKRIAAVLPWIGGVVGASINGLAIREIDKAATTYYEAKVGLVCVG